jgi:hypothetical protein
MNRLESITNMSIRGWHVPGSKHESTTDSKKCNNFDATSSQRKLSRHVLTFIDESIKLPFRRKKRSVLIAPKQTTDAELNSDKRSQILKLPGLYSPQLK